MSRLPRFYVPGVPLHIIQRGNDRQAIFRDPDDLRFFLALLRRAAENHGVSIHAYVLMTNHVHLLLTPGDRDSASAMMQSIGRVYVQRFNTRHGRTGTLWEGRYKAAVVEDERYLITCMRYIELNPVRAGIVPAPGAYRWSSFRANALGESSDIVVPHDVFRALGDSPASRGAVYRELFGDTIPESDLHAIRDATQHTWAIGGESFRARIDAAGRRAARLPMGRPRKPPAARPKSRV